MWSQPRAAGVREPALAVGAQAPEILFGDAAQKRTLALSALRGRPVVIAFSPRWNGAEALPLQDALAAELRGLGAVLLVIAAQRIWLHQADDPAADYELARTAGASREAVHHAFGIHTDAGALFVIDAGGKVRWRTLTASTEAGEARGLLAALHNAGEAMRGMPPGPLLMISRRELVLSSLVAAFAMVALPHCDKPQSPPPKAPPPPPAPTVSPAGTVPVKLQVNGAAHELQIEPRVTLLDALREQLGLTGTKKGCDHGQCGACTVLVAGRRINSCLALAIAHQAEEITTIEGLARGDTLHPVQTAFIEHDAFQCGYCTPGQILSAVSLLSAGGEKSADEIREKMSGNLCRCGAYNNIVAAILSVQRGAQPGTR